MNCLSLLSVGSAPEHIVNYKAMQSHIKALQKPGHFDTDSNF